MRYKILIFALLPICLAIGSCAKQWDQEDDAKCRSWGLSGTDYLACRQMFNNQRAAAFAQISSGLNQIGQATSPANRPAIIPPCMAGVACNRNYY